MAARVLFTTDCRNSDDENRGLYCRVNYTGLDSSAIEEINSIVKDNFDPVHVFIKKGNNELVGNFKIEKFEHFEHFKIEIDILTDESDDFVQYHGIINMEILKTIEDTNNFVTGIGIFQLFIWIYGLLVDGKFDNEKYYKFDLVEIDNEIYWIIRVLHFGLFKIICKIQLEKKANTDLEEYFVEDLERYYQREKYMKQCEQDWELERSKYLKEIKLLKDQNEISKLRNSVKLMKQKITSYFLPLVNSLLSDKKELKEKIEGTGDIMFSSSKKRNIGQIEEEVRIVEREREREKERENEKDDDLDWMQRERNKRVKVKQDDDLSEFEKFGSSAEEGGEGGEGENIKIKLSDKSDDDDDSFIFSKRDRIVDDMEVKINTSKNNDDNLEKKEKSEETEQSILIEEDTQLDENTEISDERDDNELTEISDDATELSGNDN